MNITSDNICDGKDINEEQNESTNEQGTSRKNNSGGSEDASEARRSRETIERIVKAIETIAEWCNHNWSLK